MSDPLTQARNRIAELCGYTRPQGGMWWTPTEPCPIGADGKNNPIPASLDFVSKVWPEDAELFIYRAGGKNHWGACYGAAQFAPPLTGDELADRMVLLADVLAWLQSNDPPAFAAAVEKIRKEIA